jgi:nucleoside-diphosphate-sugar epimerase
VKVLVTGGTSGLGLAMASALATAGATVALPGGPAVTGMLPLDAAPEGRRFLEPAVMGPPIVWLASDDAAGVHDERSVAVDFERWLRDRNGSR